MKIDLEREQNNVVKLNIEIPAKDAVEAYNKASQRIAQHVNIPGFRKGKAPRNIVEQHVGVERIKYEALDGFLPRILQTAIQENELDVIAQPEVESYDFNIGEDLKVVAKVELRPEVELGQYKGLTIDVEGYKIPDDAFDKALDSFLTRSTTSELVVDRPANDTDLVTFDFDGYSNGEKIKNGDGKNYTLDLANSNFIPGFAEQLVGHNVDEEFEINVNFPESYHEAKLAGQPATFKIKVHEIKQKVKPELNDEFAKKVGFDTVDALKSDIQSYLDKNKESQDKKAIEIAVFDKVMENVKMDVQPSMIEREQDLLLNDYRSKLEAQGFSWEQVMASQNVDEINETVKSDAEKRIKNSLLIDKIAKVEEIKLEPSDMTAKMTEMQEVYHMDKMEFMQQLAQNPNLLNGISQQILSDKVTKFLLENNTINLK